MKHDHLPSIDGWIGILYATTIMGSVLVGTVVHSASPEGLALGYALGFLISAILWYAVVTFGDWHRGDE